MIRRKLMPTRLLQPGMKVDQSIIDRMGRTLIARNSTLDEYIIDSMMNLGIMSIYIQDGEYDPADDEKKITPAAKKNIERLHTDDPTKVTLSASVRERVAEGIQYIYNNTESEAFAKTTASITDDLMNAIENNDAVAIDINALKTSDEYTFKHSVDVATIAMILAKQQSLSKQEIYEIGISGLLHDIGKTQIPLEILNKPGRLDEKEFAVMKQHPVFGYHMIKRRGEFSEPVCLGVLQHHEKLLFSDHEAGSHKTSRSFHHKYHDKGRINTCFLNVRINRTCSISWKTVSRLFHRIQPP